MKSRYTVNQKILLVTLYRELVPAYRFAACDSKSCSGRKLPVILKIVPKAGCVMLRYEGGTSVLKTEKESRN
jgi:hypothetical protein